MAWEATPTRCRCPPCATAKIERISAGGEGEPNKSKAGRLPIFGWGGREETGVPNAKTK